VPGEDVEVGPYSPPAPEPKGHAARQLVYLTALQSKGAHAQQGAAAPWATTGRGPPPPPAGGLVPPGGPALISMTCLCRTYILTTVLKLEPLMIQCYVCLLYESARGSISKKMHLPAECVECMQPVILLYM
jgi:hypothetical protein